MFPPSAFSSSSTPSSTSLSLPSRIGRIPFYLGLMLIISLLFLLISNGGGTKSSLIYQATTSSTTTTTTTDTKQHQEHQLQKQQDHDTITKLQQQVATLQSKLDEQEKQLKEAQTQLTTTPTCPPKPITFDIVVARYRELDERDYLKKRIQDVMPPGTIVRVVTYNKYDHSDNVVPNVGRDPHTILTHIVQYYDHLADVTLFLHGSFRYLPKMERFEKIISWIQEKGIGVDSHYDVIQGNFRDEANFELASWRATHNDNRETAAKQGQVFSRAEPRPLNAWVREKLGMDLMNAKTSWLLTFAAGRNVLLRNRLEDYERWRAAVAEGGPNGEVMHYMERCIYGLLAADTPRPPTPKAT